jgi:HEAT repeat protein
MVPDLVDALRDPSPAVRLRALSALERIGVKAPGVLPGVARCLRDESQPVRELALKVLRTAPLGDCAVLAALDEVMRDAPDTVRKELIPYVLETGPSARPVLKSALYSRDIKFRIEVAGDLKRADSRDLGFLSPLVVEALRSRDRSVRGQAIGLVVPALDMKAITPALRECLRDPDPQIRDGALHRLLELNHRDPVLTQFVEGGFRRHDHSWVMWTIRMNSYLRAKFFALILKGLTDKNAEMRADSARTLGEVGPIGLTAAPALIWLLYDRAPSVRLAAAEALGRLGPLAFIAVPALRGMIAADGKKPARWLRFESIRTLGTFGPAARSALPDLLRAAKDPSDPDRAWLLESLGKIAPRCEEVVVLAREGLRDDSPGVRSNAVAALGFMGKAALPDLLRAAKDEDPGVRQAALRALVRAHKESRLVLSALREGLRDHLASVQVLALEMIGLVGERARDTLPDILNAMEHGSATVHWAAVRTLGRIGADPEHIVPVLEKSLKDVDGQLRLGAALSLLRIQRHQAEAVQTIYEVYREGAENFNPQRQFVEIAEVIGTNPKHNRSYLLALYAREPLETREQLLMFLDRIDPQSVRQIEADKTTASSQAP